MAIVSPAKDSVPRAALTQLLRELPNYVVLRNEADLFGNLQRGGDVDLVVGDLELAERTLIRRLGVPVRIMRSSYVRGYSYDWGHVDLLPTIEWRGACYLRVDEVLESRRRSANGWPVPRIAHEALVAWLQNLLFGGFFKQRYAAEIRQAVETDGLAFRQALIEAAGNRLGGRLWQAAAAGRPEISAAWTRSLRLAVWWRACFRSPVRTIHRYFAYMIAELRLRFAPPAPWIGILGSEGSRKSSLVNEIVHRFAACPYAKVKAFHWRPRLIARVESTRPDTERDGRPYRGPTGSDLSLLALAADWLLGYWTRLVHLRAKGYILSFDGMYLDLVVGPNRDRHGAGPRLARALRWVLPKPDLVFLLDSEPDGVRHWRQEVHVLNGSLPLSVLVDEVERAVRSWMLDRSVASLSGAQAPITAPTASAEGSTGAPTVLSGGDGAR